MRLSHNMASLNVYRAYSQVLEKQSTSLSKITSGYKVNSAKDNPNAIAESERMRIQIRGMQMASRNVQDGISMLQTAESGLDNISSMLQRVRELTVQAGNGTNTPEDKADIQNEISKMLDGINSISNNTEFNGVKLLVNKEVIDNNKPGALSMQTGSNVDEKIGIPKFNLTKMNEDGSVNIDPTMKELYSIDATKAGSTNKSLKAIDDSIALMTSIRTKYGALENRFESNYESLGEIGDKIQGAESSIRDVDIAEEAYEYAKDGVLVNAGLAMMVQSNKFPQDVLSILSRR